METKRRLYLVSFADSRQYRLEFDDVDNKDPFHHTNPLAGVEKELKEALDKEFAGRCTAYYTTPKVEEIPLKDHAKYDDYPVLDAKAVDAIKKEIITEAKVRQADDLNNANARFAEIDKDA